MKYIEVRTRIKSPVKKHLGSLYKWNVWVFTPTYAAIARDCMRR